MHNHSHSSAHEHHDDRNAHDAVLRHAAVRHVTWVSVIVNLLLSAAQIVIGFIAHAQSLIADGIHSLSDMVDDFVVLYASHRSQHPADEDHPYGHERIETLASLVLGVTLGITGAAILWAAGSRLADFANAPPVAPIAFWIALITLAAKELLFRYMLKTGEAMRSPMMVANAWHARADAASSLVVAACLAGSLLGWRFLDPVAAVVVGLMILRVSWQFSRDAVNELIDTAVPAQMRGALLATIAETHGVEACLAVRTRRMAHKVLVDTRIQVGGRISVSEGHLIAEAVRRNLLARHQDVLDVMVHVDTEANACHVDAALPDRTHIGQWLRESLGAPWLVDHYLLLHYLPEGIEVEIRLPEGFDKEQAHLFNERLGRLPARIDNAPIKCITYLNAPVW